MEKFSLFSIEQSGAGEITSVGIISNWGRPDNREYLVEISWSSYMKLTIELFWGAFTFDRNSKGMEQQYEESSDETALQKLERLSRGRHEIQ